VGIDVVELCDDDEGIDVGRALPTAIGAGEQPGFSAQGDAAQRAFGGVIRQAEPSVVEELKVSGLRRM